LGRKGRDKEKSGEWAPYLRGAGAMAYTEPLVTAYEPIERWKRKKKGEAACKRDFLPLY